VLNLIAGDQLAIPLEESKFMRKSVSILGFVLTCLLGIGVAPLYTLTVEWYAPAFTREEASMMVGRRVRNIHWTEKFSGAKCPANGGVCADVKVGERGSVIGLEEVSPNRYFFVVRWDEPGGGEPMLSYFGRRTRRVFLEVE
jgi:hypothetical protein